MNGTKNNKVKTMKEPWTLMELTHITKLMRRFELFGCEDSRTHVKRALDLLEWEIIL